MGAKLLRVHIVVGELRQIVPDFLQTAYEALSKDSPTEGSELVIHKRDARGKCKDCTWEGGIEDFVFICPSCGSFQLETLSGTELYLESLEVDD